MIRHSLRVGFGSVVDLFDGFDLSQRQELCDIAINAKQFLLKYPPAYYTGRSGRSVSSFTAWDPPNSDPERTTNYQRSFPTSSDPDPEGLRYRIHPVATDGDPSYVYVGAVPCVKTENVKWYLTFGWVNNFMYLLEESRNKETSSLLVTGIFEPPAIVANKAEA